MKTFIWRGVGAVCLMLMPVLAGAEPAADAGRAARMEALFDLLRIEDTVAVMREEGLVYADQIAGAMLPDGGGRAWREQVSQLYDVQRMQQLVEQGLRDALEGADLAPMSAFYSSPAGRRTVELELAARRAFLDPGAEAAARAAVADARVAQDGPQAALLRQIGRLIESGDLVERNVAASLNADMMFWSGVIEAGGEGPPGEETDLPAIVAADIEERRRDTAEWMTAFLLTACGPLAPEQMEAYATFFETREGQVLNAALFEGFNGMYDQLAYLLGNLAGVWMTSAPL